MVQLEYRSSTPTLTDEAIQKARRTVESHVVRWSRMFDDHGESYLEVSSATMTDVQDIDRQQYKRRASLPAKQYVMPTFDNSTKLVKQDMILDGAQLSRYQGRRHVG